MVSTAAASRSKCGFTEFGTASTPPKRYLKKNTTVTWDGSVTDDQENTRIHLGVTTTNSISETTTYSGMCSREQVYTPGATCVLSGDWTGGPLIESWSANGTGTEPCGTPSCTAEYVKHTACAGGTTTISSSGNFLTSSLSCIADGVECNGFDSSTVVDDSEYPLKKTTTTTISGNCETSKPPSGDLMEDCYGSEILAGSATQVTVETLSEEDTTAAMKTRAEEALTYGAFASAFSAISSQNLATNELSYSLQRAKYRVDHGKSALGYLKVWFKSSTNYAAPVDAGTYTWTGGGYPGEVTGDERELDIPPINGQVELFIDRWSCVPGYDPGEDGPDGYPA